MADIAAIAGRRADAMLSIAKQMQRLSEKTGVDPVNLPRKIAWAPDYRHLMQLETIAGYLKSVADSFGIEEDEPAAIDSSGLDTSEDGDDGVLVTASGEVVEDGEPDGYADPASMTVKQLKAALDGWGVEYASNATKPDLLLLYQQTEQNAVTDDDSESE